MAGDQYDKKDCEKTKDEVKSLIVASEIRLKEDIGKNSKSIDKLWTRVDDDREKVVKEMKELSILFQKYKDKVSLTDKLLLSGFVVELLVIIFKMK